MERRFKVRLTELLDDAVVDPAVFRGVVLRLQQFVRPLAQCLHRPEQQAHRHHSRAGLVSNLERQNVEAMAYHPDQDRQGLQKVMGQVPWDHRPLVTELVRPVGTALAEADAVLVLDPSAFPKKGTESVGVQRPGWGRLGKIDNGPVGVDRASVSRRDHAWVDFRLDRPHEWAQDRTRRPKAGGPRHGRFQTRHQRGLEMLPEPGSVVPTPFNMVILCHVGGDKSNNGDAFSHSGV